MSVRHLSFLLTTVEKVPRYAIGLRSLQPVRTSNRSITPAVSYFVDKWWDMEEADSHCTWNFRAMLNGQHIRECRDGDRLAILGCVNLLSISGLWHIILLWWFKRLGRTYSQRYPGSWAKQLELASHQSVFTDIDNYFRKRWRQIQYLWAV